MTEYKIARKHRQLRSELQVGLAKQQGMIPCIGEPDIIANTAHGHVPARIQVNIVVVVYEVLVGCGVLLGKLIFDKCDAVKTLQSWFTMVHPYTPLTCV